MKTIELKTDITSVTEKNLATILVGVHLAEYFIKEGHTAEDLRSAILTTMHIRLEG